MGRPIQDDDEVLELPGELTVDDELTGLPGADEAALADLSDGPEDVGLDTDVGTSDGFEPAIDEDEDFEAGDEGTLDELVAEVDSDGDEGGWLEESEGTGGFDEDVEGLDDESYEDDGGLEGVDDPLVDGIDDDDPASALDEDDEDDPLDDELPEDALRRDLDSEGARPARG